MTPDEYARWWQDNTDADGELVAGLPEPVRALAAHVQALQDRIDLLDEPDEHDLAHGPRCRCYAARCACSYAHPEDICLLHKVGGSHEGSLIVAPFMSGEVRS